MGCAAGPSRQRAIAITTFYGVFMALASGCVRNQAPPVISPQTRQWAQEQLSAARSANRPPIASIADPEVVGQSFVYDPDGLIDAALREGKDPARVYGFTGFTFQSACVAIEKSWYYCKVT